MERRLGGVLPVLFVATILAAAASPLARAAAVGDLRSAVPSSAHYYLHFVRTPELSFMEPYERQVLDAFKQAQFGAGLRQILESELAEEEKAKLLPTWDQVWAQAAKIDWAALLKKEYVVGGTFEFPVPSFLAAIRLGEDKVGPNAAALREIMRILSGATDALKLDVAQLEGVEVATLQPEGVPIGLSVASIGDVLLASTNKDFMSKSIRLLQARGSETPLAATDRFRLAVGSVQAAESTTTFVDGSGIMAYLQNIPDQIRQSAAGDKDVEMLAGGVSYALGELDVLDYIVGTSGVDKYNLWSDSRLQLKPGSTGKALLKSLKPGRGIRDFENYVPSTATSFTASSGLDWHALYAFVEDTVRLRAPDGAAALAKWAQFQEEAGFHLDADLLSNLAGEIIFFKTMAAIPNPMLPEDSVILLKVKDPAKMTALIDKWVPKLKEIPQGDQVVIDELTGVEGKFRKVTYMAVPFVQPVFGTMADQLVVATSEPALRSLLATRRGEADNITKNQRFAALGADLSGPVEAVSYTNITTQLQRLAQAIGQLGFLGRMVSPGQGNVKGFSSVMGLMSRLAPVILKLDFMQDQINVIRYDASGNAYVVRAVMAVKPPAGK